MGQTTFSGPIKAGTVREGASANLGTTVLCKTLAPVIASKTATNHDFTFGVLPAGARIVDIAVDQTVVPGGSSTTTFSVGSTSGGAELMAAVATTAGGRFRGTATAATQLAWSLSSSADTTVYVRCVVGTDTTAAGTAAIVTITYIQQ
jgi:hypothetical protein